MNTRKPSGVFTISAGSLQERFVPISVAGAHGLDIEKGVGRAFVACDGKAVAVLDVDEGKEIATAPIAGNPMQFGIINGEIGYTAQ